MSKQTLPMEHQLSFVCYELTRVIDFMPFAAPFQTESDGNVFDVALKLEIEVMQRRKSVRKRRECPLSPRAKTPTLQN